MELGHATWRRRSTAAGLGVALLAALGAGPIAAVTGMTAAGVVAGHSASVEEAEVLRLTNEARAVPRMCGSNAFAAAQALAWNDLLGAAAIAHSTDMSQRDYFGHTNPDGLDPFQRMDAAGYTYQSAGENIAAGQTTPQEVVTDWLESPAHCEDLMNPRFTEIGVGHFLGTGAYTHYWSQEFGTPAGGTRPAAPQAVASQPAQVQPAAPDASGLAGILGLRAEKVTTRTVKLAWNPDPQARSYQVRVVRPGGQAGWHRTRAKYHKIGGLRRATSYEVQLREVRSSGRTEWVTIPLTTS